MKIGEKLVVGEKICFEDDIIYPGIKLEISDIDIIGDDIFYALVIPNTIFIRWLISEYVHQLIKIGKLIPQKIAGHPLTTIFK
jgi:hypothetical protein